MYISVFTSAVLDRESIPEFTLEIKGKNPDNKYEPWPEISNNVVCATSKGSDQPAHARSLIRAIASRLYILLVLSY